MTAKEKIQRLIDTLPESALGSVERFLEELHELVDDPVYRALVEAPEDDEPETEAERAAVTEARQALARGETLSLDELSRELGI